jgi:hypothetical protein
MCRTPRERWCSNAKVELINTGTGQTRETNTDGLGNFIFTQLLPGALTRSR